MPTARSSTPVSGTTWPSTTIRSSASSTAAMAYGWKGSAGMYGGGGRYRAPAYDQTRPRLPSRHSTSSEPSLGPVQPGLRQARSLRGKYGVRQAVHRVPMSRTSAGSVVNQPSTAGRRSLANGRSSTLDLGLDQATAQIY